MRAQWSRHGRDILAGTGARVPRGQSVARDSNAQEGAFGMRSESRLSRAAGFCALVSCPSATPLPAGLLDPLMQIPPSLPRVSGALGEVSVLPAPLFFPRES